MKKSRYCHRSKINIYRPLMILMILGFMLLPAGITADDDDDNNETYIVTLKDGVNASSTFENKYELTQLTAVDHGIYVTDAENAAIVEDSALVESVTETGSRTLFVTANDPAYTDNTQWALPVINAEEGWDVTTGSDDVTVVVIDTGFTYDHEDNGNVTAGKDYVESTINTYDCATHGTACAGLIGAATNNSLGITAACWNVHVVMLRTFYTQTIGSKKVTTADDADTIAALYDAIDVYDADVISMSFGGTKVDDNLGTAIEYAYDHGAILVAAAGNSGEDSSPLEYPAAYDEVIGVGAVNSGLEKASYSTANESVYIAAPGSNIFSLGNASYIGSNYSTLSGTSLATPYVAALAALARTVDPDISQEEFKYYLRSNSEDLSVAGYDIYTGYGLINYGTTLEAITADQSNTKPSGTGTVSDPYLIANESELDWFKTAVDSGNEALCGRLTADITITDTSWYPIESYHGTFDGDGHTIEMGTNDSSLFDSISEEGVVQNLTASGAITCSNNCALITTENSGLIQDCTVSGSVSAKNSGGICSINDGTIIRCVNSATISGTSYSGGVTALSEGGIVSYCYNTGVISAPAGYAAGICAFAKEGSTLFSCYDAAAVSGTVTTRGIAAKISDATVSNCFYDSSIITNGTSTALICGKTTATMQTEGFICLLNHGNGYFAEDTGNTNNGYPVLSTSALTTYFDDVAINAWYVDYVYELAAENIVNGKGGYLYDPENTITRAEYTVILARASGEDLSAYANQMSFADVETNQWYTSAIAWAYDHGIVNGVGDNLFAPDSEITREELATITVRYVAYMKNSDLSAAAEMAFSDAESISDWAKESIDIMAEQKILTGFPDGSFGPQEQATRAQAATIVDKVLKVYFSD